MLVTLIPIVPIGTKHVGNDMGLLIVFYWDCPIVPDVGDVVGMLVVAFGCVLMLEII